MRWARLVLAVVLAVGWTSAAAAEGARMLWKKSLAQYKGWEVMAAFESRMECMQRGQLLAAQVQRQMEKVYALERPQPPVKVSVEKHPGGYTIQVTLDEFAITYLDIVCLPDTIDTRGKRE